MLPVGLLLCISSLVTERKKSVRNPEKSLKRTLYLLVIGVLLGGGAFVYYEEQDDAGKLRIQEAFLDGIDVVRESKGMPGPLVDLLDGVYDLIPASVGVVVDVGGYKEESPSIYGGIPRSSRSLNVLANAGYWVGYDEKMQNPAWSAYRLFLAPDEPIGKRPPGFNTDNRTRARVKSSDYTRSGYDRGHLAPNYAIAHCYGRDAQLETFLMSNITPQRPDLNRKLWRDLEHRVAKRYTKRFGEVWVITGPIYYRPTHVVRLHEHPAIPDAFFKIVFEEHPYGLRAEAFIIPQNVNGDEPLRPYLVSIDDIETLTGLDFCPSFPEATQVELEAIPAKRVW